MPVIQLTSYDFFVGGFLLGILSAFVMVALARKAKRKANTEATPPSPAAESPEVSAAVSEYAQQTGAEIFKD